MSDYMRTDGEKRSGRDTTTDTGGTDASETETGGRKDPGIRHHDWLDSHGPASDTRRMGTLIDFADWMCAIDQMFDRHLPVCWIRHPWLVLNIDALYDEWLMAYRHDDDGHTPLTFLNAAETTIQRIAEWSKSCGLLEPGHDCSSTTTTISTTMARRRALAHDEGWAPGYAHAWPYGEAAAEHMMDRTAWPDPTNPGTDNALQLGAWQESATSDMWEG